MKLLLKILKKNLNTTKNLKLSTHPEGLHQVTAPALYDAGEPTVQVSVALFSASLLDRF